MHTVPRTTMYTKASNAARSAGLNPTGAKWTQKPPSKSVTNFTNTRFAKLSQQRVAYPRFPASPTPHGPNPSVRKLRRS